MIVDVPGIMRFDIEITRKYQKTCKECGQNQVRQVGTQYWKGKFYLVFECLKCNYQYWVKKN